MPQPSDLTHPALPRIALPDAAEVSRKDRSLPDRIDATPRDLASLPQAKLAALAEFAAGAGHEINNPLAVICGRVDLLLRQETHPEKRRDLATIHAQARRVYEMIADLMLFARPPQPELATFDIRPLLDELAKELAPACAERGIELQVEHGCEPLPVRADRRHILVALRAICDNGLDAMQPSGRLSVSGQIALAPLRENAEEGNAQEGTAAVRIVIQDSGPGFDDHVRQHLFDPFFSGRSAGRRLGMGLAKTWRIIQLHGGVISAEHGPSRGAAFVVTLPLAGDRMVEHAAEQRAAGGDVAFQGPAAHAHHAKFAQHANGHGR